MDRGAWWATLCDVPESQPQLSNRAHTPECDGKYSSFSPEVTEEILLSLVSKYSAMQK